MIIYPNFVSLAVAGRNDNIRMGIRFKQNLWLCPSVAPIYSNGSAVESVVEWYLWWSLIIQTRVNGRKSCFEYDVQPGGPQGRRGRYFHSLMSLQDATMTGGSQIVSWLWNMCIFELMNAAPYLEGPSIYYVSKRAGCVASENGYFYWYSYCTYADVVGGWLKTTLKMWWRNIWMFPYLASSQLYRHVLIKGKSNASSTNTAHIFLLSSLATIYLHHFRTEQQNTYCQKIWKSMAFYLGYESKNDIFSVFTQFQLLEIEWLVFKHPFFASTYKLLVIWDLRKFVILGFVDLVYVFAFTICKENAAWEHLHVNGKF